MRYAFRDYDFTKYQTFCGALQSEVHKSEVHTVGLNPAKAACPQWTDFVGSQDHSQGQNFHDFGLKDTMFKVRNLVRDLDNSEDP